MSSAPSARMAATARLVASGEVETRAAAVLASSRAAGRSLTQANIADRHSTARNERRLDGRESANAHSACGVGASRRAQQSAILEHAVVVMPIGNEHEGRARRPLRKQRSCNRARQAWIAHAASREKSAFRVRRIRHDGSVANHDVSARAARLELGCESRPPRTENTRHRPGSAPTAADAGAHSPTA